MNQSLDRGLFMAVYIGIIQIVDMLTVQLGYIKFTSLWAGALVLIAYGLYKQWRASVV